jgi:hypothetical protein
MRRALLHSVSLVLGGVAYTQQPVQSLPKVGGCPLGWFSSGSYCIKSR